MTKQKSTLENALEEVIEEIEEETMSCKIENKNGRRNMPEIKCRKITKTQTR